MSELKEVLEDLHKQVSQDRSNAIKNHLDFRRDGNHDAANFNKGKADALALVKLYISRAIMENK